MKILAPLNPTYNINALSQAGANAFYIGYVPTKWLNKYGNGDTLNRRGHVISANFTEKNIDNTVQLCHSIGKRIFVVFNNHQYSKEEYEYVSETVKYLKKIDIDGIITADINIVILCHTLNIPSHLSTCATNYNHMTSEFYNLLGVEHIILPRDISLDEMAEIVKNSNGIEFEAFVYNSPCRFSESVCLTNHGQFGNICKRLRTEEQYLLKDGTESIYYDKFLNLPVGGCALCNIFRMNMIGIEWLKIVERTLDFNSILESCRKVHKSIQLCENCNDEISYTKRIRDLINCTDYNNCYYR